MNEINLYIGTEDGCEDVGKIKLEGFSIIRTEKLHCLEKDLETERMRLIACGVVANANSIDSKQESRKMHEDFKSDSLVRVINCVDREMLLREQNKIMIFALQKLSRLGNEPNLGNSDGNIIAQRALNMANNLSEITDLVEEELDFSKALAHLQECVSAYRECGKAGLFALGFMLPLEERYNKGERTKELYEEIMEISL